MRVAVFNPKGGVGKTTTALNLGAVLARAGYPVLLLDMDPQAHLSSILNSTGIDVACSLFALYQHGTPISALERAWPGIGQFVPAQGELIKVDSLFGKGPHILNKLHQALTDREKDWPDRITLMDCCPFLGVLSLNALFAADRVLVPVASDHLSLRGAFQIDKTLRILEPVMKRRIERRYLLTRFDRRRRMGFEIRDKLLEAFGDEVCATAIGENVAVAEAPARGCDILSYAPHSRGAADYGRLAEECIASNFLPPTGMA